MTVPSSPQPVTSFDLSHFERGTYRAYHLICLAENGQKCAKTTAGEHVTCETSLSRAALALHRRGNGRQPDDGRAPGRPLGGVRRRHLLLRCRLLQVHGGQTDRSRSLPLRLRLVSVLRSPVSCSERRPILSGQDRNLRGLHDIAGHSHWQIQEAKRLVARGYESQHLATNRGSREWARGTFPSR
jgi:hypothetical protein